MRKVLALLAALACGCAVVKPPNPAVFDAAASGEAPIELHRNLVFVAVMVNGKGPFNMMVDTGTTPSAIDVAAARELGLTMRRAAKDAVGGGKDAVAVHVVDPLDIKVGTIRASNVEFAATDLSGWSKGIGVPVHGVLGHSFLTGRFVQIDFPQLALRFGADARRTSAEFSLPFRYVRDSVLIDAVDVNDLRVTTLFDTGFNGSFAVMPAAVPALVLQAAFDKATPRASMGFRGPSTSREGVLDSVRIGTLEVKAARAIFWEKGTGHDTLDYGFTIGNGFLKDYVVTLDYPRSLVIFGKDFK